MNAWGDWNTERNIEGVEGDNSTNMTNMLLYVLEIDVTRDTRNLDCDNVYIIPTAVDFILLLFVLEAPRK